MAKARSQKDALNLAYRLIRLGARGGIVEFTTGCSAKVVRNIHREIRGGQAPGGPLPHSTFGWLRRHKKYRIGVQIFLQCHRQVAGKRMLETIDIERLCDAYEAYWSLTEGQPEDQRLLFTHAYAVSRDIVTHQLQIAECGRCGAYHPWELTLMRDHCEACAETARLAKRLAAAA